MQKIPSADYNIHGVADPQKSARTPSPTPAAKVIHASYSLGDLHDTWLLVEAENPQQQKPEEIFEMHRLAD